jgi:type IV fimbrial biogenesis protein FimT
MRNNKGFTIIELMTVIGILSILSAIAIPGFIGWRSNAQLGRAARNVYSTFQKAKSESVRRNENCGVEFRANDFVIYIESNLVDEFGFDAGTDEVIQTINWSEYPGVELDPDEGGGDGLTFDPDFGIVFASDGLPRNSGSGLGSGTVFLINQSNARKSRVTISTAGNIRIN